jgi:HEAT repeat protein
MTVDGGGRAVTDIDELDLTPQQRSALQRADENPEHLTDYDAEMLCGLLTDGEEVVRVKVARVVSGVSWRSDAWYSLAGEAESLVAALDDEDWRVRGPAAKALGWIGREAPEQVREATGPLIAALEDENTGVREEAAEALGRIGSEAPEQVREATGPLIAALDDEDWVVRREAFEALGYVGPAGTDDAVVEATDRLCTLLSDHPDIVRKHSAIALGRLHAADRPDSESLEAELEERFDGRQGPAARFAECLNDDQLDVAVAAAFAQFRAGSTDHDLRVTARDRLREGLDTAEHRRFTAELVAELAETGPAVHPMMRGMFADDDAEDAAVRDLVPDLIDLLDDSDEEVRRHSCRALGHLDADAAVDDLERLASEADDGSVREAAGEALDGIGASDESGATTDASPEEPSKEFSGGPSEESPGGPSEEPHETPGRSTTADSAPDLAPATPEPGDDLSYDEIEREATLGRGAADVYEARIPDGEGSRRVVLKEPRFAGGLDADTREGFLDEARYWALVADHPHVVDLVAWGDDPHPWLVAEYLDGGDLSGREAELDEALWTCARIADALHEAHHLGLRHLDLKPANVLLRRVADNPWDVPKVSDWGLARFQMEHSGRLSSFTPRYGAPEQFLPGEFGGVDNRTDLYQLGLVLYELTTGAHPFPDR